jgi:hypothetical protein
MSGMPDGFTEQEWDRIKKFARMPRYRRNPEVLLPEDDHTSAEDR